MKGILLAGGSGTRLHPMTLAASKQLLPVYDKPMVYYPLSTLMLAGIQDIMLISTPEDLPQFRRLLGDGSRFGVRFEYAVQPKPGRHRPGLPDRPRLAGGRGLCPGAGRQPDPRRPPVHAAARRRRAPGRRHRLRLSGARSGALRRGRVRSPTASAVEVVEKPAAPTSNWAITGLYFYDKNVSDIAPQIRPSARGELEITDLNRVYLEMGTLHVEKLSRGCAWLDAGTPDSLLQAATFVQTIQSRTGMLVGCPEEVAFRMGFIDADRLRDHATHLGKTELGRVLMELAEGEMAVKVEALAIPDVKLITPPRFSDPRGFFSETWNQSRFAEAGIPGPFIQDNHAVSTGAGVLRGLHCQIGPNAQGKLVRCVKGAIYDVAVDVRHGSPTFGQICRRGDQRRELDADLGAGRLPARLLHADRGDRGDLQGHRRLRQSSGARGDLERPGYRHRLAGRRRQGDPVGQGQGAAPPARSAGAVRCLTLEAAGVTGPSSSPAAPASLPRRWPHAPDVLRVGRPDFDFDRPDTIEAAFRAAAPRLVVNAAAYTAVDAAETDADAAYRANRDGPGDSGAAVRRGRTSR